jgi:hypothetical protein
MAKVISDTVPSGKEFSFPSQSSLADGTHSEGAQTPEGTDPSQQGAQVELIQLGGFPLVDLLNAPWLAARKTAQP